MTSFSSKQTFSSVKEAAVYLAYSARHAHLEELNSLQLWADVPHHAALLRVDSYEQPILAVKFNTNFQTLGKGTNKKSFRLPREIHAYARGTSWAGSIRHIPVNDGRTLKCRLSEVSGIKGYDAFFEVLNEGGFKWLSDNSFTVYHHPNQRPDRRLMYFKPHLRSFTFESFMQTVSCLQDTSSPWKSVLLNQDAAFQPKIDLTATINPELVEMADEWIRRWETWNSEQKAVIDSVHDATGRVVITKGIAGTGKTLLQAALAVYFTLLGFKVLVTPPSNSNATHTAIELEMRARRGELPAIPDRPRRIKNDGSSISLSKLPSICRIFASSLGKGIENTSQNQVAHTEPFHVDGASSSLHSLVHTLRDSRPDETRLREYTIEQKVIDHARKRDIGHVASRTDCTDPNVDDRLVVRRRDCWDVVRRFIALVEDPETRLSEMPAELWEEYGRAYGACKRQCLAATDIAITTTGNARCAEILGWVQSGMYYGIPSKGIIVLCDEAFKDTELGTWNAITVGNDKVKGVFMFGDDK